MKPKHQRLLFIGICVLGLCVAAILTLRAFRDNIVFFYSPSELAQHQVTPAQRLRIGGLVATGSIVHGNDDRIQFVITDGASDMHVTYSGLLPNLFREGQGVVAEGHITDTDRFAADSILAKHDEKYMPREVVDALKRTGRWQEENGKMPEGKADKAVP
jgi:cytochrome c-type biogenesis protein CcmE